MRPADTDKSVRFWTPSQSRLSCNLVEHLYGVVYWAARIWPQHLFEPSECFFYVVGDVFDGRAAGGDSDRRDAHLVFERRD